MGLNNFEKKYQKVPIKIGMAIAIAIGFVFLLFFILGGLAPPRMKIIRRMCSMTGLIVMLPEACN